MLSQVFVCLQGGVCPIACWDTHNPPRPEADTLLLGPEADTPSRHPPGQQTQPCTVHGGIRSTSGRYASHWNAFVFICKFCTKNIIFWDWLPKELQLSHSEVNLRMRNTSCLGREACKWGGGGRDPVLL